MHLSNGHKTVTYLWSCGADSEHPHGAHNRIKCVDGAVHSPTDCRCHQRWVQQDQILSHPGLEMVSSGTKSVKLFTGLQVSWCFRPVFWKDCDCVSGKRDYSCPCATLGLTAVSSLQRASQVGGPVLSCQSGWGWMLPCENGSPLVTHRKAHGVWAVRSPGSAPHSLNTRSFSRVKWKWRLARKAFALRTEPLPTTVFLPSWPRLAQVFQFPSQSLSGEAVRPPRKI